jgi:hypothetical protein
VADGRIPAYARDKARLGARQPEVVRADRIDVSLGLGIGVDLHDVQSLAGRLLSAAGAVAPAEAAGFSAESLPGWYDDWVLLEGESWRQLRLHALEAVAGVLAQAGRFGVGVAAAQAGGERRPVTREPTRRVDRRPSERGQPVRGAARIRALPPAA